MSKRSTPKSSLLLLLLLLASGETGSGNLKVADAAIRGIPPASSLNSYPSASERDDDTEYLSRTEQEIIDEINLLRSNPARYARLYLEPLRSRFQGRKITYLDQTTVMTREGIRALDECIRVLKNASPAPSLSPRMGLSLAARDHVRDQGRAGTMGHDGSNGSSPFARMNRYGTWEYGAGENIAYGYRGARTIVAVLLIDDGVASRGHRKNLLNGSYRVVGVNTGPHRLYREMCVMDFAGGYTSR